MKGYYVQYIPVHHSLSSKPNLSFVLLIYNYSLLGKIQASYLNEVEMFLFTTEVFVLIKRSFIDHDKKNKDTGVAAVAWQLGFSVSFVEVSFHAALKLGFQEQIALSATCSGFQNAPLCPPSASLMPL